MTFEKKRGLGTDGKGCKLRAAGWTCTLKGRRGGAGSESRKTRGHMQVRAAGWPEEGLTVAAEGEMVAGECLRERYLLDIGAGGSGMASLM